MKHRVFYCWLCRQRRHFAWADDADGGNWHGRVCGHALWSRRQHKASLEAR